MKEWMKRVLCVLAAFWILPVEAAHLFKVGVKEPSALQLNALRQERGAQLLLAPQGDSVNISMAGVTVDRTEIIIRNEVTGRSMVLSGFSAECKAFTLTPLMIAEMKVAKLGDGDQLKWSLLETAPNGDVQVIRSATFTAVGDGVKLPVFQYRVGGAVKTTAITDRRLVAVGRMNPSIIVADPDDPEQAAMAAAKAEELAYYVYAYELPDQTVCMYDEVAAPAGHIQMITAGENLVFDYTLSGAPTAAQTATSYGATLWGAQLAGSVPVSMSITFQDLGDPNIIGGSYPPSAYSTGSVWYPSAIANQLVGYDLSTAVTDIRLVFNTQFSFYFGTNPSTCPSSQKDYITVLLHEMCHGLGFYDSINPDTGTYGYGDGALPLIYDTFLYYNGSRFTALSASSRYTAIRSAALYWDGSNAKTANGGSRIRMYAPTTYKDGSSVSHWDTSVTFANWMGWAYTAPLHTFNTRKLGLMKDIGWTLAGESLSPPTGVSASDGTYSDKVSVTWSSVSGATHYRVSYSSTSGGTKTALSAWQPSTSYDDTGVAAGVTRYYWVQAAKDSSGTGATGYSASDMGWRSEPSTTYPDQWDPGDNTAAGATLLTVSTSVGSHGPHGLADNDHYDCFKINMTAGNSYTFESTGSSDVYAELFNSTTFDTANQVAYNDDGGTGVNFLLTYTPATSGYHYLRVRAFTVGSAATYTLNHSYVEAQVAVPANVAATDGTHADKVRVTWSSVSGASHYCVYRATSSTGTKTTLTTTWQTATSFDDTTAVAGTTYYYWVKAGTSTSGANASNFSAHDTGYRSASAKPDLVPYQPSGWDSKLVVSTVPGTTTSASSFLTTDTLYLDSAVLNDGSIEIPGPISIYDIYVDGVLKARHSHSTTLPGSYYTYYQDYNLGFLSAGTHTIKIVADPNGEVDESNEANNEFTRTITVAAPAVALSSIAISGPSTVNENATAAFTCTATYSDASTANVTAQATWSENSSYATISGGVLSAGSVSADQTVTVTASFTAGAVTKTATTTVTIKNLADPVTVSNLVFQQRPGTKLVDITYDLASMSAQTATVELTVKNGTTPLSTASATGHVGTNVTVATGKAIVWNMAADWNGQSSGNISVTVTASLPSEPLVGMVLIPAGAFQMGDPSTELVGDADERPMHNVLVSGFYLAKHEVTKELWDEVRAWGLSNGYTDLAVGNSTYASKGANHPVHNISWNDAVKWCNALSQKEGLSPCYTVSGAVMKTGSNTPVCNWSADGYRLPTEAEWEKAARGGGAGRNFPWGDTVTHSQANYYSSSSASYDVSPTRGYHPSYYVGSSPYSSPVGSFVPNGYGLYDMAGNMWEWCWDWYGASYYSSSLGSDPKGPASGTARVARGGSWANGCRTADRDGSYLPAGANYRYGFRIARTDVTDAPPSGMVAIPAGTNSGTHPEDGAYSLTVEAFYMDETEVTKAQWDAVYAWAVANGYSFDNIGTGKATSHPVHTVSWYDCVKWCNARSQKEGRTPCYTVGGSVYKTGQSAPDCNFSVNGYRLPTEVEWEYAARGGQSGKRFPWGDTIQHSRANYYSFSFYSYDTSPTRGYHPSAGTTNPRTMAVKSFAANGYGLYDITGNVMEWCNDSSYEDRSIRGGGWDGDADLARCIISPWTAPDIANSHNGFRAVCR